MIVSEIWQAKHNIHFLSIIEEQVNKTLFKFVVTQVTYCNYISFNYDKTKNFIGFDTAFTLNILGFAWDMDLKNAEDTDLEKFIVWDRVTIEKWGCPNN